jgi:hypothetical protein
MKTDTAKIEQRSCGEIRQVTDKGIVEAYLTCWDSVDSYKSTFRKGAFKKTFEERGGKIRLIWNHEELAGKVLEVREDDYGPFVRAQFNMDTIAGREAYAHVKAGDVDSFSFGFNVIQEGWKDGIREITEVRCLECGPVIFEANSQAKIVDVRTDDFNETVAENDLRARGWRLFDALSMTLDDIFWSGMNQSKDEVLNKVDTAISNFHGAYLSWLQDAQEAGIRSISSKNDLEYQAKELLEPDIVKNTSLTEDDLKNLRSGKLLSMETRSKLAELPEEIRTAHHDERRKAVETLCDELRESGFTEAEKMRFAALLHINESSAIEGTLSFIENFRNQLR